MTKKPRKIIVVDDNNANLTACKKILRPDYEVFPAPSAAKMFDLLENIKPDLILLDVDMEDVNGYEAAAKLKENASYSDIPFIFLSGRIDATSEMFGLNLGALDYIHKPFVSDLLLRRIETNLSLIESKKMLEEHSKTEELSAPLQAIINTLNTARDTDDPVIIKDHIDKAIDASKQLLTLIEEIP
ncbi:MAG: response regulator [Treponema sp.]|nr:response regulator [Treponema sp.]